MYDNAPTSGGSGPRHNPFARASLQRTLSCTYVTPTNETALEVAVDQFGPVAISIDATQASFKIVLIKLPPSWPKINFLNETKDFMDYQFGIYEGGCSSDPKRANHGVLIVGYDERKINWKLVILLFYLNIAYVIIE